MLPSNLRHHAGEASCRICRVPHGQRSPQCLHLKHNFHLYSVRIARHIAHQERKHSDLESEHTKHGLFRNLHVLKLLTKRACLPLANRWAVEDCLLGKGLGITIVSHYDTYAGWNAC